jgi:Tfp pilus assembly protein PilE
MKRTLLIALVAIASICVASAESLQTTVNKMNTQVAHAFMHNDLDAFEKITRAAVTSDFKHTEMGHSQTYDEMLGEMKQSFAMIKKITVARAKTSHIAIHGDNANSMTTHHMVGVIVGPDKKNHKMVMDGTTKDTYRKEDGQWKLAEMNWVKQGMTLDGKPFDASQMGGGH